MKTEQIVKKQVETFEKIAEYIKTIDHAVVFGIEETEDSVLTAVFYVAGFDAFMFSEIQRTAKENGLKVSFNVEPYSQKAIKLTLVLSEVSE